MSTDNVLLISIFNAFVKKKNAIHVFNFNKNVALTSLPVDFDPEVLYMF